MRAVRNNRLGVVQLLLNYRHPEGKIEWEVNPAAYDNSAIQYAAEASVEMVNLLLDYPGNENHPEWMPVDPSANDNAAIEQAVTRRNFDVVFRLVADPRVDITQNVFEWFVVYYMRKNNGC